MNQSLEQILLNIPTPVRFEIVPQRMYNVYGFEKDSTIGILYTKSKSRKKARILMEGLEKYYGVN
jgi:hypothetical protein